MVASADVVAPPLCEATLTWDVDAQQKHQPRDGGDDNGSWYKPGPDALLSWVRNRMKQPELWRPGREPRSFLLVVSGPDAALFRTPKGHEAVKAAVVVWPSSGKDVKPLEEADYAIVSVRASTRK